MLNDVKSGAFLPDSTRSGRFPIENPEHDEGREDAKSDASSSSSDGSENESEADFETKEAAIAGVVGRWDQDWQTWATLKFVLHGTSCQDACMLCKMRLEPVSSVADVWATLTCCLRRSLTLCTRYATRASDRMACDLSDHVEVKM